MGDAKNSQELRGRFLSESWALLAFPNNGERLGSDYRFAVSNSSPEGESGDGQDSVVPKITATTLVITSQIVTIDQPVYGPDSLMTIYIFLKT